MYILIGILVAVALYVVMIYNGLVKARQMAEEAWSGIDVQLKRRADLIPNLIETVKGYASHEKSTFEEVVRLRNQAQAVPLGDVAGRAQAEGLLGQALGKLFALAEAYPDLKANQNFAELQASLENLENEIQMSRRYYNGAARDLNVRVESFPNNLIAGQFGFSKKEYFEITNEADRAVPSVKF
ncbi:LemA family protein [Rhizobium sp. NTR19]|uniref:LemA family protein n=1 Tax=Neorhizobium turbinariae TaxID=2937795 RepID=A0ABT0IS39_9HYPH|nr:LemA family protein [Neorhizobium turbinariae]MCK8780689.1 LemA family protein [Neorhizobium turbinariae]